MKYYIAERKPIAKNMKNAANKARADVEKILEGTGYTKIDITIPYKGKQNAFASIKESYRNLKIWEKKLTGLSAGDEVVIQFPVLSKNVFLSHLLKKLNRKNIKIVILIHDLESLRYINKTNLSLGRKIRLRVEERPILSQASQIIVHNDKMGQYLIDSGYDSKKISSLEIFDYLHDETFEISPKTKTNELIIAGNLDANKIGYLRNINQVKGVHLQLFGANYTAPEHSDNITYNGSFLPEDLPENLHGSFGLIWDGDSINSCTGVYGDYLKYNNPHKTSLYLSTGFPVIVWNHAAMADFVLKEKVGFVVTSLNDIANVIANLSEDEYKEMVSNVAKVSERLRQGYYLKKSLGTI